MFRLTTVVVSDVELAETGIWVDVDEVSATVASSDCDVVVEEAVDVGPVVDEL